MAEPTIAPAAPSPDPPAAPPASSGAKISDVHYDRLSVAEQSRYSRMKAPNGSGGEWRLRSEAADGKPASPAPDAPTSVSADGRLVVGEGENRMELSDEDIRTILRESAERVMRASTVPATPGEYRPELPKDLKLPGGVEVKIDGTDAAFKDLQAFCHSRGLSQSDMSAALAIFASYQAREAATLQQVLQAEIKELGPNGVQRITSLHQWLRGTLGDEAAKPISSMLVSERHVAALELLASKFTSQGSAPFSQAHREPAQGSGKVSDEEYQRMSPAQRWNYSRSFDQTKFK